MAAELIDTHAHLDDPQLEQDLPGVLERAQQADVLRIVSIATSAASSQRCTQVASAHSPVFASVGIHPNHASQAAPTDWDVVVSLAREPKVVAIGETGLDRHWHDTPFPIQEEFFGRHWDLSRQTGLPVVVHCREADTEMLAHLRSEFNRRGPLCGVMHSFTGNQAMALECLAMGMYLSFAGMLTYKNAAAIREVAAQVPLDRLLVETDSPYLSPAPLRGKRNEPANICHTASCLAECQGLTLEQLAARTTENAKRLFKLT